MADKKTPCVVYGLPHCSTCKKALAWLDEHGVDDIDFRDVKANPPSRETIAGLAEAVGGVGTLFSKRALKYRAMGLHERAPLSDEEMLDLMAQEYTFITRPVILHDGRALCGFGAKKLEALL